MIQLLTVYNCLIFRILIKMSTPAKRRLLNDYKKYQKEAAGLGVLIKLKANNMMICEAIIFGPDDTEWESGVFRLVLEFKDTFP